MKTGKIKDLFYFAPRSNVKAGDGLDKGRFPLFTSSQTLNKWIDSEQYFDEALVFGTGGSASIHYINSPFSTSTDCIVAVGKNANINPKFVYYYLLENIQVLERGFKGAGLKHISKAYIEEINIPLFDFDTQSRIVTVLDRAKTLLDKRTQALDLYDELLSAVFLDMFGDPLINTKNWEQVSLDSLCSKIVDCPHDTPEYLETNSNFYCIRSSDIQNNEIDLTITKTVSQEVFSKRIKRHKPQFGQVVYTREGGRLGNAARLPKDKDICLGQRIMLFVAKENVATNEFIWSLLNSDNIKSKVRNMSSGGAAPRVNISQLKSLDVIRPPIELQRKFGALVYNIDRLKDQHKKGLCESEDLLSSLSQLAFNDDLSFNTAVDLELLLERNYDFFKKNSNRKLIQLLLERLDKNELNEKKIYEQGLYNKAKGFLFELVKEKKVIQSFDDKTKQVKLTVA
jgi:type I restriction enzyme S subunit